MLVVHITVSQSCALSEHPPCLPKPFYSTVPRSPTKSNIQLTCSPVALPGPLEFSSLPAYSFATLLNLPPCLPQLPHPHPPSHFSLTPKRPILMPSFYGTCRRLGIGLELFKINNIFKISSLAPFCMQSPWPCSQAPLQAGPCNLSPHLPQLTPTFSSSHIRPSPVLEHPHASLGLPSCWFRHLQCHPCLFHVVGGIGVLAHSASQLPFSLRPCQI